MIAISVNRSPVVYGVQRQIEFMDEIGVMGTSLS